MTGRSILRGKLWLFLLGFVALAPPAPLEAGKVPDDLQLDRGPEALLRTEPVPNPHATIPCEKCHTRREESYDIARKFGILMPLVTEGENDAELCERCHREHHAFHPANFPLKRLGDAVAKCGIFPLAMPFEGYTKVTCTSCHAVHFPHTSQRLLRGFPVDPRVGGGRFETRLDFCTSCHGDELLKLSGHAGTGGDQGCGLCHQPRDISGKIGGLKRRLNETCAVCHPLAPGEPPHFTAYNPFPEFKREELEAYGVSLVQGRFTCATCHVHHRENPEAPFLQPAFVTVVSKSVRIDPHQSTRFCQNCHPVAPPPPGTPGAVAPLIEEDVTRLCRGCHGKEGGLRPHHPLAGATEAVGVPPGWPLRKDGTLGCQTCHLAGHAPRDPANPKWLRDGPYRQRNEVCFRCHREERYRGRNIHEEAGERRGCEFCHEVSERTALRPEGKVGGTLAEPNLLCLHCHGPGHHPASADHTVRPKPHGFLMIDEQKAPLSQGRVTCHTCHDSHSDNTSAKLLRTSGFTSICSNCHPY